MKVLVTTVPFGETDPRPIDMLNTAGVDFLVNPFGRKLNQDDLESLISDFEIIIAGTEPITNSVMDKARKLRLISRVGIGLDSVDLLGARRRGISVSYTPDAPSPAVAELTIGMMVSLLRKVQQSNCGMRSREWKRYMGSRLSECVIGIIGVGRIGKRVIKHLETFGCKQILVNDIVKPDLADLDCLYEWCDKKTIFRKADVISLHLPLTVKTKNLIRKTEIESMKPEAVLINTSRGGIINESDLYETMVSKSDRRNSVSIILEFKTENP